MAKYLSNRQKNLKVGISSYTETDTVLEITGKVGIGTTNATKNLDVVGDTRFRGAVYDTNNTSGSSGQVLVSVGSGITWSSVDDITAIQEIINTTLTGISVQEESVGIGTSFTTINFIGAGVTATSNGLVANITFDQQVGPRGPQGPQGAQGAQGFQGPQGPIPETTVYLPTYAFKDANYGTCGNVGCTNSDPSGITSFADYNSGGFFGVYDTATTPGFIVYVGFSSVAQFNRVSLNVNYPQSSGHLSWNEHILQFSPTDGGNQPLDTESFIAVNT